MLSFANSLAHSTVFIKHFLCVIFHEHGKCILRSVACPQSCWGTVSFENGWPLNSSVVALFCHWEIEDGAG